MANCVDKERAIRAIVRNAVKSYANGFSMRHLAEVDTENRTSRKKRNITVQALGLDDQCRSLLVCSLDKSLDMMLDDLAINIMELIYGNLRNFEDCLYEMHDCTTKLIKQNELFVNLRTSHFFFEKESLRNGPFWNLICKSKLGHEIVIDELMKDAHFVKQAFGEIDEEQLVTTKFRIVEARC